MYQENQKTNRITAKYVSRKTKNKQNNR